MSKKKTCGICNFYHKEQNCKACKNQMFVKCSAYCNEEICTECLVLPIKDLKNPVCGVCGYDSW